MLPTRAPALTKTERTRFEMADTLSILHDDSVKARFWAKVDVRGPDECWHWLGTKNRDGYGRFVSNKKVISTHRFSLSLATQTALNTPFSALHSCDNPACVNPSHLRWGTQTENMRDAFSRGRMKNCASSRLGESNFRSKLTKEQVLRIRELSAEKQRQADIAKIIGISLSTVKHIVTYRIWKHV